jgi:hypothetical protein
VTHKFKSELIEEDEIFYKFVLKQEGGVKNADLLDVVFEEYINLPFLQTIIEARSFIAVGESPLLDRSVSVEINKEKTAIEFKLMSQLFRNKFVPPEQIGKDNTMLYMELPSGEAIGLKNAADTKMGQILYLLTIITILNGMVIEVNIENYIPRCDNCVFKKENLVMYSPFFSSGVKTFLDDRDGCVIGIDEFGDKKTVKCAYFVRDTNPDLRDAERTLEELRTSMGGEYFEGVSGMD